MLPPGFEPVLIEQEGGQSARLDLMIGEDLDDELVTGIFSPDASCGPTPWPKAAWYIHGIGGCVSTVRNRLRATLFFSEMGMYDMGNHDSVHLLMYVATIHYLVSISIGSQVRG
jgi:hypothetical protein